MIIMIIVLRAPNVTCIVEPAGNFTYSYGCQLSFLACSHGSLAIHFREISHLMSETEGHERLLEVRSNYVSESQGSQEWVMEGGVLGVGA